MISASHNKASDNGIKIFRDDGSKMPDSDEAEIAALTADVPFESTSSPRTKPRGELARRYEEHLANLFPSLDLGGRKIVIDAANGAGSKIAPSVLRCFGAEVITLACEPDGANINAGVGALHPEGMAKAVVDAGADFGICLDGDGDRGIFCDETGQIHDGDSVMALMGIHMASEGTLPDNTVVATVMSNLGLRRALSRHDITLSETPVGDRAVVAAMLQNGFALGGEQSGHIIFGDEGAHTGDGLYTALRLASIPGVFERGFHAAFAEFKAFPQLLINVPVTDKPDLASIDAVQEAARAVTDALGEDGRVVLRYSGTEDLCRVMVEGPTEDVVRTHTQTIVDAVERELGTDWASRSS